MSSMLMAHAIQMPRGWHDGGMMWGMHWGWWSFWILALLLFGWVIWRTSTTGRRDGPPGSGGPSPEDELRARFARGEIDEDELRDRLRALEETGRRG